MRQKVVIIGVSYSSRLSLARAIGVLGCEITIVAWSATKNDIPPIDSYSRYVNRTLFCKKEENAFIKLLKEQCTDIEQKVILLPDCDFSVSIVDKHLEELRPFFLLPHIHNTQGAIVEWSDKTRQKELASKLGMNVVKSIVIDIKDGQFTIPNNIQYPCFPKALASVSGGKAGMFRCNNVEDLNRSLTDIITRKRVDARVMIEDYMEIDKEYAVLGFSDGVNVSIPGVIQFLKGSKTQPGIALQGKIMPIFGFEDIIEKFKSFVRSIGLLGLFDIDFYQCGDKLYFSELNLRYGGSGYSVVKMGVNLPAMFVNCLCGNDLSNWDKQIINESVYINERIASNDLLRGYISLTEFKNLFNQSDIFFIRDDKDSEPYKVFRMTLFRSYIRYFIKKIIIWKK